VQKKAHQDGVKRAKRERESLEEHGSGSVWPKLRNVTDKTTTRD